MRGIFTFIPFVFTLGLAEARDPSEQKCADLISRIQDPNLSTVFIKYVPAGSVIDHNAEGVDTSCFDPSTSSTTVPVDLCRVALHVATTENSSVLMEVWLPENWEGRFLHTGNSGTGGCIDYPQLAYGTTLGFATVGTNNGHNGSSASAFYHQPEVAIDFSWRAMVVGTTIGKTVTQNFYEKDDFKSYHLGCSTGGRQGWTAAQSHPDLFDGIVAGAPVINNDGLVLWFGYVLQTVLGGSNTSETYLTPDNWKRVHDEVLEQCDRLDGASDSIIEATALYKLDSQPLLCANNNRTGCLSLKQVSSVEKIFSPWVVDGELLHPGHAHGDEIAFGAGITSQIPATFLIEAFRYIFTEDLSWDPSRFTPQDALNIVRNSSEELHTFDPNLKAFRDQGGKILHWHGQSDPLFSVFNSDWYYDLVLKATASGLVHELDKFYRYFRISGTYHCSGGPGANFIG